MKLKQVIAGVNDIYYTDNGYNLVWLYNNNYLQKNDFSEIIVSSKNDTIICRIIISNDFSITDANKILSNFGFEIIETIIKFRVKSLESILATTEIKEYTEKGVTFMDESYWNFGMNYLIDDVIEVKECTDSMIYDYVTLDLEWDFKKEWLEAI